MSKKLLKNNKELMSKYIYEKNKDYDLNKLTLGSSEKVWWKCIKGHEWQARISHIANGVGCPYCSGHRAIPGETDLFTTHPNFKKEWNYTKNVNLDPEKLKAGSNKKVWWKCDKGHEWEALINDRTSKKGCPYCSGHRVLIGYNDLATIKPDIAKEWNYKKNGNLKPTDVTSGSNRKVWWKCKQGHQWESKISNRVILSRRCPYCSNQRILKGYNDLATINPELSKEWHPTKNEGLKPTNVSPSSGKKYWWIGKCKHEWQASIAHRANGTGCPICFKGIQTSFPEQAIYFYLKQIYPDSINSFKDIFNNGMELDIYIPSLKLGIEYDGMAYHKSQKALEKERNKYDICKQNNIKLIRIKENNSHTNSDSCDILLYSKYNNANYNDLDNAIKQLSQYINIPTDIDCKRDKLQIQEQYLQFLKSKSLEMINPKLASEWHPTKNGRLTPAMFSIGSSQKVWWQCKNGHEWQQSIAVRNKGIGCSKCSGKRAIKGENDLATLKPELVREWNYKKNGNLKPEDFKCGSSKKIWWIGKCGHEYKQIISSRCNGARCPICINKKILIGYNDLNTTRPDLAKEWHPTKNGSLKPTDVTAGSQKQIWWQCSKGHEWKSSVGIRNKGYGCNVCANDRKSKS